MDQPTYIVTGGAGFVGSNVVAALLARSPRPRIIVIDTFRSGSFANLVEACDRSGAGTFDGEVIAASSAELDYDALLAHDAIQAVFHLGAITDTTLADESEMIYENVEGFVEMMQASAWRRIPLVYASSAATYGSPPQARDRTPFPLEAAGKPNNVYGFSKWLMECEHRRFARRTIDSGGAEPHIVGLRYFNVFGPGERCKGKMASMVYQLAMQMLSGKRPSIFSDGTQARDQVYIDDVVSCTLRAAGIEQSTGNTTPAPSPGIYNLGSGQTTSFNQIIAALRSGLNITEDQLPTDYFEMPADIRAFYQDYTCADMSRTESGLNWKPRWNPAEAMSHYAALLKESAAPPGNR